MKGLLVAAAGAALFAMFMNAAARAEDCPPGAVSCKVLVITPQEEQSLIEPNQGILATAEWANRVGLSGPVAYWKNRLATAPAGKVVKPADANANPAEKK